MKITGELTSPSDETIHRGPPCVYDAERSHAHVKDPAVHFRVQWTMETPK